MDDVGVGVGVTATGRCGESLAIRMAAPAATPATPAPITTFAAVFRWPVPVLSAAALFSAVLKCCATAAVSSIAISSAREVLPLNAAPTLVISSLKASGAATMPSAGASLEISWAYSRGLARTRLANCSIRSRWPSLSTEAASGVPAEAETGTELIASAEAATPPSKTRRRQAGVYAPGTRADFVLTAMRVP